MHRDATFDALGTKPRGTLFKMYCTMEPSLRYLYNAKQYAAEHWAAAESCEIDPDEFVLHLERLHNTISGVYDLLNREVSLIQLRAKYGDNPSAREKAKLEHIRTRRAHTHVRFVASQIDAWLQLVLTRMGVSPPAGEKWSGHSLRKGAASGAAAVGVGLDRMCHMGGWSIHSKVVHDYIDPTCPSTPAAYRFFGWLLPAAMRI
jgi:hypothetical protein